MSNWILFFSLLTPNFIEDIASELWTAGDEVERPTAIDRMFEKFDAQWEREAEEEVRRQFGVDLLF